MTMTTSDEFLCSNDDDEEGERMRFEDETRVAR